MDQPTFVYNDPVPASQLTNYWGNQVQEAENQRRAAIAYNQLRNQQQQQGQQNALQQAYLNQQNQQFGQEAQLRRDLQAEQLKSQMDLLKQGQSIYDKYPGLLLPKGLVETTAALNEGRLGKNEAAQVEESVMNQALAGLEGKKAQDIYDIQHPNPIAYIGRGALAATGFGDTTDEKIRRRELQHEQDISNLITTAKPQYTVYNTRTKRFVAKQLPMINSGIGQTGTGIGTGTEAAAPSVPTEADVNFVGPTRPISQSQMNVPQQSGGFLEQAGRGIGAAAAFPMFPGISTAFKAVQNYFSPPVSTNQLVNLPATPTNQGSAADYVNLPATPDATNAAIANAIQQLKSLTNNPTQFRQFYNQLPDWIKAQAQP